MRCATPIVALLAALALAACGDDDSPTAVGTGTEAPQTQATTPPQTQTQTPTATAPTAIERLEAFRSPSGNIGCTDSGSEVRCDIREKTWQAPPKPASCELDYGQGVTIVAGSAAELVCAGDTALDDGAPVLAYGEANRRGSILCTSAQAGITCRDEETGRGFFISRERYELL